MPRHKKKPGPPKRITDETVLRGDSARKWAEAGAEWDRTDKSDRERMGSEALLRVFNKANPRRWPVPSKATKADRHRANRTVPRRLAKHEGDWAGLEVQGPPTEERLRSNLLMVARNPILDAEEVYENFKSLIEMDLLGVRDDWEDENADVWRTVTTAIYNGAKRDLAEGVEPSTTGITRTVRKMTRAQIERAKDAQDRGDQDELQRILDAGEPHSHEVVQERTSSRVDLPPNRARILIETLERLANERLLP